jgi:curved DNA-binding protein CbpA
MARRRDSWHCYLILGLEPGASVREVKAAYRALVKKWHPDQFHHDPHLQQLAEDKLKEINQAYTTLLNPGQSAYRARYGRPSAGQQASKGDSQYSGQSWSATGGRFHYQSSYYRTRQAKAAGNASRARTPYSSGFFVYASPAAQNGAPIPRWTIMLVMFFLIAMVNTFTSSVLNGSSSRSYASAPVRRSGSSRPQFTNFISITTMSEKELKEKKQQESQAAAAGTHVPLILNDKEMQRPQHEPAAGRKEGHGSAQKKVPTPQDAPAVK